MDKEKQKSKNISKSLTLSQPKMSKWEDVKETKRGGEDNQDNIMEEVYVPEFLDDF
jgi:hypothetical protein